MNRDRSWRASPRISRDSLDFKRLEFNPEGDWEMTSKWIKAGTGALALMFTPLAAQGADIPRPYYKGPQRSVVAYYNWSGLYAGVNAGYGWGSSAWTSPVVSNSPKGMLVGATLGYNMQAGSFVYGLEGDIDWATLKGDTACGAGGACETKNNWLGTARGRIGYAFDGYLPYFTGGAAFGDIKATNTNAGRGTASATKTGWTVGGGLEYAFMGNLTAKVEYLYVNLGSFDCGTACSATPPANVSLKENIFRVGLNYKFGGGY
jgi:outer membrane immunogenic protein